MSIKKIVFFCILLLSIFVINNMVRSIYGLWQKQSLAGQVQSELAQVEKENSRLKHQLSSVNTSQFVEEEARDKLFLVKPGEKVMVIPSLPVEASQRAMQVVDRRPNWERWWRVFF
jgi:cell division protein FtsB